MAKKTMKKKGGCYGGGGCNWRAGKRASRRGTRGRRMRGGMYGFGGNVITAGTLEASPAYTGPVGAGGEPVADPTDPKGGYTGPGGRRRKTAKKGKKGSKKTRKYRMRGGANSISMGGTYASFGGEGVGGMANYAQGVKPGNPI